MGAFHLWFFSPYFFSSADHFKTGNAIPVHPLQPSAVCRRAAGMQVPQQSLSRRQPTGRRRIRELEQVGKRDVIPICWQAGHGPLAQSSAPDCSVDRQRENPTTAMPSPAPLKHAKRKARAFCASKRGASRAAANPRSIGRRPRLQGSTNIAVPPGTAPGSARPCVGTQPLAWRHPDWPTQNLADLLG